MSTLRSFFRILDAQSFPSFLCPCCSVVLLGVPIMCATVCSCFCLKHTLSNIGCFRLQTNIGYFVSKHTLSKRGFARSAVERFSILLSFLSDYNTQNTTILCANLHFTKRCYTNNARHTFTTSVKRSHPRAAQKSTTRILVNNTN